MEWSPWTNSMYMNSPSNFPWFSESSPARVRNSPWFCTWIPLAIFHDFLKVPLLGWGISHDFPKSSPAMDLKSPRGYSPFRFHSSPTLGARCRRFWRLRVKWHKTTRHTYKRQTHTGQMENNNYASKQAHGLFLYSPPGQNFRLYDQTCLVQHMCINVIIQQKGMKFQLTEESVQSSYHKKKKNVPLLARDH